MKKAAFIIILLFIAVSCSTPQKKKDYSADQERAREHGQEAFQDNDIND